MTDPHLIEHIKAAFAEKPYLKSAELAPVLRMSVKTLNKHRENGDIVPMRVGAGSQKPRRVYTLDAVLKAKFLREEACPSISPPARRSTSSTSGAEVVDFSVRQTSARKRQHAQ